MITDPKLATLRHLRHQLDTASGIGRRTAAAALLRHAHLLFRQGELCRPVLLAIFASARQRCRQPDATAQPTERLRHRA